MQKNLLIKSGIIIGVLIVFLGGIFGIPKNGLPKSWNREGLKQAFLDSIHLGLDVKGGVHLILQVMVNEAVSAETDHAVETLKEELQKAHITYADVSKPDADHPERITIKGAPLDGASRLAEIVRDRLPEFVLSRGADNTWNVTMSPTAITSLHTRTVEQSIEAIRTRVDSLGVSEPVIQQSGMGTNQILVQLAGVADTGQVREI